MKLVHWPLMGGLLHLVQREGDWAGPQPAQAPPRCTVGGHREKHCIILFELIERTGIFIVSKAMLTFRYCVEAASHIFTFSSALR